jgi:hypothetical protein
MRYQAALRPDSAQQPLPFDKGWDIEGERAAIVADGGRQVLQLETGEAHRRDVRFTDGTIDLDVQLTDRRSFVYVYFRVVENGEREEFYLRPHKSNLPDAVQYAPVWQGRSAWQLYHGPGGTAAAGFTPGKWTHVRVAVRGRQAAIFVDDMTTPALFVPRLAREPQAGHLALRAFLPANGPGAGPIARFANVTVSPEASFDFDAAAAHAPPAQSATAGAIIVRAWSLSRAFVPKQGASRVLPGPDLTGAFTRLQAEPDGLLALHRYVKVPANSPGAAAVARVTVRAASAGAYAFDLGFSDVATVFVNGQPLFTGDASYSFDRPRREGLIGYDQARLYLPLVAGDNEIAVVVSDSFGGWGLMGRFPDAAGLTLGGAR